MVRLVDVPLEDGDPNRAVTDIRSAITESGDRTEQTQQTRQAQRIEATVDDPRFAGKSTADIVNMYKNLESHSGRLASQLGEARQAMQQAILVKRDNDLRQGGGREPIKIQPADLMVNPTEVLDRYYESRQNPEVSALKDRLAQLEQQLNNNVFQLKHPRADDVTADPAFSAWVRQTPLRMQLAQASANGHTPSADLLLTEWQQAQADNTNPIVNERNRAQTLAKSVQLEGSGTASESAGRKPGKTFRRKDLISLRQSSPDKYEDPVLQNEIVRAYVEGRVTD